MNRTAWARSAAQTPGGGGVLGLVDRTPWGNAVFARVNAPNFSGAEREFYRTIRAIRPLLELDVLVFFECAPAECVRRVARRDDVEERAYNLADFERLDTEYFVALVEAIAAREVTPMVVPQGPQSAYPALVARLLRLYRGGGEAPRATVRLLPDDDDGGGGGGPQPVEDGSAYFAYSLFTRDPEPFKRAVMAVLARDGAVTIGGWPAHRPDPLDEE